MALPFYRAARPDVGGGLIKTAQMEPLSNWPFLVNMKLSFVNEELRKLDFHWPWADNFQD
jgi:hypothetical protein